MRLHIEIQYHGAQFSLVESERDAAAGSGVVREGCAVDEVRQHLGRRCPVAGMAGGQRGARRRGGFGQTGGGGGGNTLVAGARWPGWRAVSAAPAAAVASARPAAVA
ncbi:hypothetical protein, partial [Mycolicibacterium chitae]|uniref:hypothetical protein n=1 Tax=Mycolicibacterium chitae TaxID=1792 RepID=UPI003F49172D